MKKHVRFLKEKRINMIKFHDDKLKELSQEITEKSVIYLKSILTEDSVKTIVQEWSHNPETWWAMAHHGWGTSVRNSLRDNVCLDDKLPSGNWDDYYIPLVEIAVGVRKK